MSQAHTALPIQNVSVDEKHDPINGHSRPSVGTPGPSGMGVSSHGPTSHSAGLLPGSHGKPQDKKKQIHPAVIIALWIALSSSVIVYNKYVLDSKTGLGFPYPVFLTTFHMALNTLGTRLLARFTHLMDGLKDVEMTSQRWYRNILPIGALFSGSLVLSNMAYLTLSVSFIQMLKAFMPVAVLIISFAFGLKQLTLPLVAVVGAISFGVAMASYGEVEFAMQGFVCQVLAIGFESSRLVMVQVLLQGLKMDPLVSLYYFAPVCAAINACLIPFTEGFAPFFDLGKLGPFVLLTNGGVAFALNVAAVFLIGAASSLTLTLAGVLKDILLILGSMFLLNSVVTPLQYFGYAIALTGLVIFKNM